MSNTCVEISYNIEAGALFYTSFGYNCVEKIAFGHIFVKGLKLQFILKRYFSVV